MASSVPATREIAAHENLPDVVTDDSLCQLAGSQAIIMAGVVPAIDGFPVGR
jgi:hypothetical protein